MKAEWSNKDSLEMPTTTNSDYIKREDAINAIQKKHKEEGAEDLGFDEEQIGILTGLAFAKDEVDAIPSADVVEVVRCKDCKWYMALSDIYGKCTYRTREHLYNEPTDYCSYGERKDNEIDS